MGRLLITILLIVFGIHAVVVMSALGYGLAAGKFDPEKRQQYLATWRGEKLVPPIEEEVLTQEQETPQQAGARIESQEVEKEITSREIQREVEILNNMKFTLETFQAKLEEQRLKLDSEKEQFTTVLRQQQQLARREGFLKALKTYSQMKPKFVKEDFMNMTDEDVVNYLAEMKPDTVTTILNQFKTPKEQEKRRRIMELLQQQKVIKFDQNPSEGKVAS